MNKRLDVNDAVAMFRDIGLDQAKMEQWHRLFEARHPAGHQEFLLSLGIPPNEAERIRSLSRGDAKA